LELKRTKVKNGKESELEELPDYLEDKATFDVKA
jgi:hypothetical protein